MPRPPHQLKIEQQLNGTFRLSRIFRAKRSGEILGIYRTRLDAEVAKKIIARQHTPETVQSWEDW